MLGGAHGRPGAFRPRSIVNVSGMSYGALSPPAITALNHGAMLAGAMQNTGEGGLSRAHLSGGELIFQIGTGYFGCRDERGAFSMAELLERIGEAPIRAIEIKLSQGAKPGLGGLLPAAKVTPEIARIRGVPEREDCVSPPFHSAFSDVQGLIAFVEKIAQETGLPVGIKSAVGDIGFWRSLTAEMSASASGPDFVNIDGGEGGTGAAPLAFSDHVALPFKLGFSRVYSEFARAGIAEETVFIGAGRLGFPDSALFALALGCDMVSVGREAMISIGCIQAQRCHTGRCPSGVATQSRWLMHGLDPELKAVQVANYLLTLRSEMLALARSCGAEHPALVGPEHIEIVTERFGSAPLAEIFAYSPAGRFCRTQGARTCATWWAPASSCSSVASARRPHGQLAARGVDGPGAVVCCHRRPRPQCAAAVQQAQRRSRDTQPDVRHVPARGRERAGGQRYRRVAPAAGGGAGSQRDRAGANALARGAGDPQHRHAAAGGCHRGADDLSVGHRRRSAGQRRNGDRWLREGRRGHELLFSAVARPARPAGDEAIAVGGARGQP